MNPPRKMPSTQLRQMSVGSSSGKNVEPEVSMRDPYVVYGDLSVNQEYNSGDATNPVDSLHISSLSRIKLRMWTQYLFYRDLRRGSSWSLLHFLAMVTR